MTILLNKNGYEPFIDFIKAFAITCVLMGHTFPNLDAWGYRVWAGMQVPLFLLVQVFHSLKKEQNKINLKKIAIRILIPFIIAETILFVLSLFLGYSGVPLVKSYITYGGIGPGSYYPWIYFQFAILLPLLHPFFTKYSKAVVALVSLLVVIVAEVLCAVINVPDHIYRLLAVRYLFLIYLGWLWVNEGIKINLFTVGLSILSLGCVIYFAYFPRDLEPIFYNTGWRCHRWPCYFWVAYMGAFFLNIIWKVFSKSNCVTSIIKRLAHGSYEIFLTQMVLIGVGFKEIVENYMGTGAQSECIYIFSVFAVSIGLGLFIRKIADAFYPQRNIGDKFIGYSNR